MLTDPTTNALEGTLRQAFITGRTTWRCAAAGYFVFENRGTLSLQRVNIQNCTGNASTGGI